MTKEQKYELQKSISDAIYIVNHVCLGFTSTQKLEDTSFSRVQEDSPDDMKRIFLPAYLKKDAEKNIKELEKAKKLIETLYTLDKNEI
jgi:hypothetical protein